MQSLIRAPQREVRSRSFDSARVVSHAVVYER